MRSGFNSKRPRSNRQNMRRPPGHHRSHSVDSSGPDVKIRGNVSQILEKYLTLARDANSSGDRIKAENYLQHADHYYRVLNANDSGQRPQQPPPPRDGDAAAQDDGGIEVAAEKAPA